MSGSRVRGRHKRLSKFLVSEDIRIPAIDKNRIARRGCACSVYCSHNSMFLGLLRPASGVVCPAPRAFLASSLHA